MSISETYGKNYFFLLSLTFLVLGLIAFSDNLITDVSQESNSNPIFIIHGIIMYAWIGVLIIQTNYIRKLEPRAHRAFGIIGFIIGVLMIIGIVMTFHLESPPWNELPFYGKANRIFLAAFTIMFFWAYLKRSNPDLHKHLIFAGMFLLMEPILSRVVGNLGGDPMVLVLPLWLILWLSMIIYDIAVRKRPHPVTILAFVFWIVTYIILT